jgi:hypothetical protein
VALPALILSSVAVGRQDHGFSTPSITLTDKARRIIPVGATRQYKTVSEALMQFNGRHIGDIEIQMDPGRYEDNINVNQNAGSSVSAVEQGLNIVGDTRESVGTTYTDSAPLRVDSAGRVGRYL